jgi:TPR repeat protein
MRSVHCIVEYIDFIMFEGKGCQRDLNEAFKYLSKACKLNDNNGCVTSGILALSRSEIHKNNKTFIIDEGIKVLEKCCNEKNLEKACFQLASIYISGIKDIVHKNMQQAYEFSVKACDLGSFYACANISQMYIKGDGVKQDPSVAETFRKKAADIEKEAKKMEEPVEYSQGIPL